MYFRILLAVNFTANLQLSIYQKFIRLQVRCYTIPCEMFSVYFTMRLEYNVIFNDGFFMFTIDLPGKRT